AAAGDRRHRTTEEVGAGEVDAANAVVVGVGEVDDPFGVDRDAAGRLRVAAGRKVELRFQGCAVAVETAHATAGDGRHQCGAAILGVVGEHANALVALVDEEEVAVRIEAGTRRLVGARIDGGAAVAGKTSAGAHGDAYPAVLAADLA